MQNHKAKIEEHLLQMREENLRLIAGLKDSVSIHCYRHLVRTCGEKSIWTDALQQALNEHETVVIPPADAPYYIDASIRIPSNRRIEAAPDAVMRLLDGVTVLMLRNEHTMDGTRLPIPAEGADFNISISGGRWEEYRQARAGYGQSGMYDTDRSFFGVSTCLLFNHLEHLTLTDMTFVNCAGFAIQVGNLRNAVFENITFENCFADGVHINGNSENLLVRNIRGEVGDDLVALNAYDWQNSSVTFGPIRTILCESIVSAPTSPYKSLRILPGVYPYQDGSEVDCSLSDAIIRSVRGIHTFKFYYQTPAYDIHSEPERGRTGSAGHIYFEDIDADLTAPIDPFDDYLNGDPVRGAFGSFEFGSNIDFVSLENVRITLHRDRFPRCYPIVVGPKSIRVGDNEIFDPYISNHVGRIELHGVTVNGQPVNSVDDCIHITSFNDINGDGRSTACGTIGEIVIL